MIPTSLHGFVDDYLTRIGVREQLQRTAPDARFYETLFVAGASAALNLVAQRCDAGVFVAEALNQVNDEIEDERARLEAPPDA